MLLSLLALKLLNENWFTCTKSSPAVFLKTCMISSPSLATHISFSSDTLKIALTLDKLLTIGFAGLFTVPVFGLKMNKPTRLITM